MHGQGLLPLYKVPQFISCNARVRTSYIPGVKAGKFVSIDVMEKENVPTASRQKLSLSLKRRFAALEREEVDQYSLVKVPKCT